MTTKLTKNFLFLVFVTVFTACVTVQGAGDEEGPPTKRTRRGDSPIVAAARIWAASSSEMPIDGAAARRALTDSDTVIPPTPTPPDGKEAFLPPVSLAPLVTVAVAPAAPAAEEEDEEAGPFTDPRFDTSFKHMLGIEEEEEDKASGAAAAAAPERARREEYRILSSFVSIFVGRPVQIIRTLNPCVPPVRVSGQTQQIMDVACEDRQGVRYNKE